jgi:hypothetical protein
VIGVKERTSRFAPGRTVRVVLGLVALTGLVPVAQAAPRTCDLRLSVNPATIPIGARKARITFPGELSDVQSRSSSGTTSTPMRTGAGFMTIELTTGPESVPLAVVAVVGPTICGFSTVRIASDGIPPARGESPFVLLVDPPSLPADREGDALVYVLAVDGLGVPRRGSAPTIRPGVGTMTAVEMISRGVWRGRWHVPAGEARAVALEAAFGSEPPATVSLARTPGEAASIEITPDRPGAPGGEGAVSAVIARILDSRGNPTESALVLESQDAQLQPPVRLERGVYRAQLEVRPGTLGGTALVTARAGRLIATATIPIASPAPAVIRVTHPGVIRPDQSSQTVLEVVVTDAAGNPVVDAPVGSGGAGVFGEPFFIGPGHWALPYRAPRVLSDTTERLIVTAGAASTAVEVRILSGQAPVTLGLKGGVALSGGTLGPAAAGELGVWALIGGAQFGLVLDVGWWRFLRTSTATVGGVPSTYEAKQNYVPILLSLAWRASMGRSWLFWATAGGGGALVSNQVQFGSQAPVSESGFAPAATGSLSTGPHLGPGSLFLEVRGTWIGDPALTTLSGSSITFLGLLGYRFDVG